jgi:hypothetical protein
MQLLSNGRPLNGRTVLTKAIGKDSIPKYQFYTIYDEGKIDSPT